jgi:membrane protein
VTSGLFLVGRYLIGLYLGNSAPASAFGAAGSLAVLLLWVYYSASVFFLGAEVTRLFIARTARRGTAAGSGDAATDSARSVGPPGEALRHRA